LAYIPPTIAGMVLCYRGKYLTGGAVTALFVAMQVKANHVQMSYYFLFCMAIMAIGYLVMAIKEKKVLAFCKSTLVLVVAGILGVCVNISNLYHTYEYSKETMRGKSELVKEETPNQTNSGLDRDYITQWSYGIGETWSLLVPNVKGGASNRGNYFLSLSQDETAMKHANPDYFQVYQQFPQYWGDQPGTSGPVYAGAFVIALFLLGAFIVKGPMKWALLAATLLSFLFAWGKNFMPFTDFCIDYIPMYSKFRAVSSALVVAEFTIPLLALLGLKELCSEGGFQKYGKDLFFSFGIVGAITLVFAIAPGLFFDRFLSLSEMEAIKNGVDSSMQSSLINNITEMRQAVFSADAWRSLFVIVLGFVALVLYGMNKIKQPVLAGALIAICLVDMWTVDKRYLNDEMFVPKSNQTETFAQTEADKLILKDPSLDYRVLNYTGSTFNENNTSYWHKSIGGYHAAKLRRYQELIDAHISKEMTDFYQAIYQAQGDMTQVSDSLAPVLNMLNTRYLILPGQDNSTIPVQNPNAYGNAWFVKKLQYVQNANEELDGLSKFNPKEVAIVDQKFKSVLGDESKASVDSTAQVSLLAYEPNALKYELNSAKGGVVVFSEIYYPGWKATLDGENVEIGRANYVLRAVQVPAGKHQLEMTFSPSSIKVTETIAWIALATLVILLMAALGRSIMNENK
ncbi:MAG: YfhO family protein, partial [Bacteroidaceae bacterium]|nr:YfhO family protein [Bacteroidaceae bacterium]